MKPRLVLADDHALVLEGLRRILVPDFDIVATAEDGPQLISAIAATHPDAVVCDIAMPGLSGLDVLRQCQQSRCRARFVFVTGNTDVALAARAFRLGAAGYVLKLAAAEELLTALREALRGRTYITPRIADQVLKHLMQQRPETATEIALTPRERDVLQRIAQGKTMKEAAEELGVSPRTIEFHKLNIMDKTGLRTVAELARYASHLGLLPDLF